MKIKWRAAAVGTLLIGMTLAAMPGTSRASGALVIHDMNTNSAASLVSTLLGAGVTASNIHLTGATVSSGTFSGGTGILGFEQGIVLGSGNVNDVVGPNNTSSKSSNLDTPGDFDLTVLSGHDTYDATVLEFDFVPNADTVYWQYVFSSEEYNEYVGSPYNDVFGFFLNGTNVATVPGSGAVVSVNSINAGSNAAYYVDNADGHLNTQMDGMTTVLTISAPVNKNQTNHIKLAIADATDRIYDSNVFIPTGSFSTTQPPCTTDPSLTFQSPLSPTVPANVNVGDTFNIGFQWRTCNDSMFDSSVTVRVRNADTNQLIAGYTLNYDIAYNPTTGMYTQPFDTTKYSLPAGTLLKVMVYFNTKLRSTAIVNVH